MSEEELELYAIILSSEENSFASALEKLALKKSSNNEIFQHIKKILDGALKDKDFKNENEKQKLTSEDGRVLNYEPLDTSVLKLRKKYANLKTEWRKISDRAKTGSSIFLFLLVKKTLNASIPVTTS